LEKIAQEYLRRSALLGNKDAQKEVNNPKQEIEKTREQKKYGLFLRRKNSRISRKNRVLL